MSRNEYPRETIEFQPVVITVDGVTVTTGIQFAIVPAGTRPTTWTAPTTLGADSGVMVSGLTAGVYVVWAKITSSPETPVVECGRFIIT